jgi:hypothetical protein
MNHPHMIWLLYALEGLFFAGLGGCVLVVLISWVSVFKSAVSKDTPNDK